MRHRARPWWIALAAAAGVGVVVAGARAQRPDDGPAATLARPVPGDRPLPINLATALQLSGARPLDIALASERTRAALAELERANVLWLPTLYLGVDYYRHDGQLQDVEGRVFG